MSRSDGRELFRVKHNAFYSVVKNAGANNDFERANRTHTPVAASTVDVIPTGAALGAEVRGVDLRDLDEAGFGGVMQAWHDHSVLLFRNQNLRIQSPLGAPPRSPTPSK